MNDIQRCRQEQLWAAAFIQAHPGTPEAKGAALGMADWLAEELLRCDGTEGAAEAFKDLQQAA